MRREFVVECPACGAEQRLEENGDRLCIFRCAACGAVTECQVFDGDVDLLRVSLRDPRGATP
jgi:uncharacterized Zn finger protein